MGNQRGTSFIEIVVVLSLAGMLLAYGAMYTIDWYGREKMKSAAYTIQSDLQLARLTAVERHRLVRFYANVTARTVSVVDLNDPSVTSDDVTLSWMRLPDGVSFERPDVGSPVTLHDLGGGLFEATMAADGSVTSGIGYLVVKGGERYSMVQLYAAGGVRVLLWSGSTWAVGP